MLTLYSIPSSGNSYKVRLLFAHLGIAFRHVAAENGSGVTRTPRFLALNPKGKVPLVVWEDGRTLSESNAILCRFGEGTWLWPADADERARMLAWMFWEQNAHETTIAVRAGILTYKDRARRRTPAELDPLLDAGHAALAVMEDQLARSPFLAGPVPSLADLSLYAYTHTAGTRGGFAMERFPAVGGWLDRVAAVDGHVPLEWLGEGAGEGTGKGTGD